jgi:hypothetical protein
MGMIKRLYHFLGSIQMAIGLIAITAILVIAGTFIEARTESHQHAAQFTYGNPLFAILLWLFFVNILFSATRRWPFKSRHIPFLITHLGLLMVLGGTMIKNRYGTQGTLTVMEGSGSHRISLPGTHALQIEKRDPNDLYKTFKASIPIDIRSLDAVPTPFPELALKVISFTPHVKESLQTWIKDGHLEITDAPDRKVSVDTTDDIAGALQRRYIEGLLVRLPHADQEWPLSHVLNKHVTTNQGNLSVTLQLDYSPTNGFGEAALFFTWQGNEKTYPEKIKIPLTDTNSLKPINVSHPFLHGTAIEIDLLRKEPTASFIEDTHGDIFLFAFDKQGRIFDQPFRKDSLRSFIAYDSGYGGYAISASIPDKTPHPRDRQKEVRKTLTQQLQDGLKKSNTMSPPLQTLLRACERTGEDFSMVFPQFLNEWRTSLSLLFPAERPLPPSLAKVMAQLDWNTIGKKDQKGCRWTALLFDQLSPSLYHGKPLMALLKQKKWPLLDDLADNVPSGNTKDLLTGLTQQLFAVADTLPAPPYAEPTTPSEQAKLFSAYLKAYGIDYALFDEIERTLPMTEHKKLVFETPLKMKHLATAPSSKLESNTPLVTLEASNGKGKETIALAYQHGNGGFKWPILQGEYLVRFQPQTQTIPFHIRLRQARQINYPHSTQPYSYESDLVISRAAHSPVETTLSMNRVYESWDGYRFYLSNISPAEEGAVKRIQIVVNHDPAKYLLTYPGACLVSLGIVLLFWFKGSKKT